MSALKTRKAKNRKWSTATKKWKLQDRLVPPSKDMWHVTSQIDRNYPLRVTLTSFELVTHSFKVGLRDRRLSYIDTQDFWHALGSLRRLVATGNPNRAGLLDVCQIIRGTMFWEISRYLRLKIFGSSLKTISTALTSRVSNFLLNVIAVSFCCQCQIYSLSAVAYYIVSRVDVSRSVGKLWLVFLSRLTFDSTPKEAEPKSPVCWITQSSG